MDEFLKPDGGLVRPPEMIKSVMGGVYEDFMRSKFTNFEARQQDIEQLKHYSEGFESIEELLAQLSLMTGVDTDSTPKERDTEAVCLSSVHQAKGLEWRVCFLVWLADGMFPNNRALEEDSDDESGLEEERRLFYVAVTRAKDELYLTYPTVWANAHTGSVIQKPSRFLKDVPDNLLEEWRVGSRRFCPWQ